MGFWQGLNEGLSYVMEDKARKKELEAARQERLDERQASMDFQREQYNLQKEDSAAIRKEERTSRLQETFLPVYADFKKRQMEATAVSGKAENLYKIFGDSNDPKVVALRNNPAVAAGLWESITKVQEKAAGQGVKLKIDLPTLLANIVVNGSGEPIPLLTNQGIPKIETFDDLATAVATFSVSMGTATAELSPEFGFIPDPANLVEGRRLFDKTLFTIAGQERDRILEAAGDDSNGAGQRAFDNISKYMEAASSGDAAARAELEGMFGQQAFEATTDLNNIYTNALVDTPEFKPYMETIEIKRELLVIVNDPNSTEERKNGAKQRLLQLGWTP
jgi:hypothetical protein